MPEIVQDESGFGKELREAYLAGKKASETKSISDLMVALRESIDVVNAIRDMMVSGWSWQKIAMAIGGSILVIVLGGSAVGIIVRPPQPVTTDELFTKKIEDAFTRMEKVTASSGDKVVNELRVLAKKIDERPKPVPTPVNPDLDTKPKSKTLLLPGMVVVQVKGGAVKIKAVAPIEVSWHWKATDGFTVDRYGDVLYIEATKEGTMWLLAYTVSNAKVTDFAACMVTTLKAPQPPPGPVPLPKPNPKPPTPPEPIPVVLDELGKLVLAYVVKLDRKEEALQLAVSYDAVVADMRAGIITTVPVAVAKLYKQNTAALGVNVKMWAGFFAWADNELTRRSEKGQLATMEQNAVAFEQFGAAFREASK